MSEQNIDPSTSVQRNKNNTQMASNSKDTHSVSKRWISFFVICFRDCSIFLHLTILINVVTMILLNVVIMIT